MMRSILAWVVIGALMGPSSRASDLERIDPVPCQITYEVLDGVYVDVGRESQLRDGRGGWILNKGTRVARFVIVSAANGSAYLRLLTPRRPNFPKVLESIELLLDTVQKVEGAGISSENSHDLDNSEDRNVPNARTPEISTLKDSESPEEFIPLLAPDLTDVGVTESANIFHGRFRLRHDFQSTGDDLGDYNRTRLDSSGAIERINGSAWSAEWAGDISYRSGNGLQSAPGYETPRLELYRFSLSRRFDNESTLRVGRFIPRELPSVGTLDGAQSELVFSDGFRAGAILGFKPTREDLNVHFREPVVAPYISIHSRGDDDKSYYSGTIGALGSTYEGDFDRLALLIDQTAHYGGFDLFASSEFDFDVGAGESRDGHRMTRLDAAIEHPFSGWTPRFGVDHYERPEIEAERDLIDEIVLEEADFFEDAYWRYWVGARHKLTETFTLDEEISYTFSDWGEGMRWRVSLSKRSLFGNDSASTTLAVYNLRGEEQEGHGGTLSFQIPTQEGAFLLQPSISVRFSTYDSSGEDFEYINGTLRGHWRLSKKWSGFGGVSYSIADDIHRFLGQVGLSLRF